MTPANNVINGFPFSVNLIFEIYYQTHIPFTLLIGLRYAGKIKYADSVAKDEV